MNKLSTMITTTMVTALFLTVSSTALAQETVSDPAEQTRKGRQHQRGAHSMPGVEGMMRAIRHLDLNEDQKAGIKLTMQALRQEQRVLIKEMKVGKKQLKELIKADVYDEEAVAALAEKEGSLIAERLIITSRAMSQVYAQLTDEQRLELEAMAAERAARREAKRQKRSIEG